MIKPSVILIIDNLEGLDVATQTPPTSIDGTFLLAMDNAQALVAMGAMFSPEIAALNLQPDGNPVALKDRLGTLSPFGKD